MPATSRSSVSLELDPSISDLGRAALASPPKGSLKFDAVAGDSPKQSVSPIKDSSSQDSVLSVVPSKPSPLVGLSTSAKAPAEKKEAYSSVVIKQEIPRYAAPRSLQAFVAKRRYTREFDLPDLAPKVPSAGEAKSSGPDAEASAANDANPPAPLKPAPSNKSIPATPAPAASAKPKSRGQRAVLQSHQELNLLTPSPFVETGGRRRRLSYSESDETPAPKKQSRPAFAPAAPVV
eukprot:tig00000551_g2034.t1